MINAKQAKELYNQSSAMVDQFLENQIEPMIVAAAKLGKNQVFIILNSIGMLESFEKVITEADIAIVEKLHQLGYNVSFQRDNKGNFPCWVDDKNELCVNFGIMIEW